MRHIRDTNRLRRAHALWLAVSAPIALTVLSYAALRVSARSAEAKPLSNPETTLLKSRGSTLSSHPANGPLPAGGTMATAQSGTTPQAPQTSVDSKPGTNVDPNALALLEHVREHIVSVQTLSAVFTYTLRWPKSQSARPVAFDIRTSQVRLMRPNFARIDTARNYQERGQEKWKSTPQFLIQAADGQNQWTVAHSEKVFDTDSAHADGSGIRLFDLPPLDGFFNQHDFITARIAQMQQEGVLQSVTLVAPTDSPDSSTQVVRIVSRRGGTDSKVHATEDWSIGADLLIHQVRFSVRTGTAAPICDYTMALSQIRVDEPMTAVSFAFHIPEGVHPRPPAPAPVIPILANGVEAPDFTVQDAQGNPLKLSDLRGKWVVLDFWATWCGPCMQAFPGVNAFAKQRKDKNVVVLAISVRDTSKVFQDWLVKHKKYDSIQFAVDPIGIPGKSLDVRLYHAGGLPTEFVIDPKGKIRASFVGYEERQLEKVIPAPK